MVVLLLSFAASVCFAGGYVLQYHEASAAPARLFLSPRLLLELMHHRIWLAGVGVMIVGNIAQAFALDAGSLAVIEPVLTTTLLFALPLSAAWRRERLQRQDWTGAVLVCAGLGLLIGIGRPTMGRTTMGDSTWLLVLLASWGAALAMIVAGKRARWPAPKAALIGGAAGVLFGFQDVLVRYCLRELSHDASHLMLTWQPYVLIVTAVYGMLLVQSAYEAGPLTAGLPPIAAGEPLVGMLIGVFALGEHLDASAVAIGFEVLGAVMSMFGVWMLGRSPIVCGDRHPSRLVRVNGNSVNKGSSDRNLLDQNISVPSGTITVLSSVNDS